MNLIPLVCSPSARELGENRMEKGGRDGAISVANHSQETFAEKAAINCEGADKNASVTNPYTGWFVLF